MTEYLSGEYGPRFVGYGEIPKPSFWERWCWPLAYGLGIGVLAFAIMLATGRL